MSDAFRIFQVFGWVVATILSYINFVGVECLKALVAMGVPRI